MYHTASFAERLIEKRLLKPRTKSVKTPLASRIDRENRRSLLISAFFQKCRARTEVAEWEHSTLMKTIQDSAWVNKTKLDVTIEATSIFLEF